MKSEVVNEITDFIDDLLTQYTEILSEISTDNKIFKVAKLDKSDPNYDDKVKRIKSKSITLEDAVDARHDLVRRWISQSM